MNWRRLAIGGAALAMLGAWAEFMCPFASLDDVLEQPARYDGIHIEGFGESVVGEKTPDGFMLLCGKTSVEIRTRLPIEKPGTYVSVAGTFRAPAAIDADAIDFALDRPEKVVVSLITLLVVLACAPLALRVDLERRAIALRERPHA